MKTITRCTRCIMDNESDTMIKFDSSGHCNYCNEALDRMKLEYFPNTDGAEQLKRIVERIKYEEKSKKYDCLVGLSGGVDSSYIIYLGHKFGLRMLAVHIDDGLNTAIADRNIKSLCTYANVDLHVIRPDKDQYSDLILSFLKASVPNFAIPQDNILFKELFDLQKKYKIKYALIGANFSSESILERTVGVNAADKKHILAIHKQFGTKPINNLKFQSLFETYIYRRYFYKMKKVLPLNYINYNTDDAINELKQFCGYEYYGGKHWESILTRFLQCYYLPSKYNFDKRKSHLSSLIITNQISRNEALEVINKPAYPNLEMLIEDKKILAEYLNISFDEFEKILALPAKQHLDYPVSVINNYASLARKFRKYFG